jgi:hypothetical protein
MSKCSVCALPAQTREAIDGFLRNGASLGEVAARRGVTKSSLWRHSQHVVNAGGHEKAPKPIPAPPKTARPVKTAVPAPVEPALPAPAPKTPAVEPPVDAEASRKRALDRTEQLWGEVSECLRLAREPVTIVKPDGDTLEVPVDLRTRSSVIRPGKDVIDLDARPNGLYDPQAGPRFGEVVFANVICMPKTAELERAPGPPAPKVIDVQPTPALTDGRTPDSEKMTMTLNCQQCGAALPAGRATGRTGASDLSAVRSAGGD